MTSEDERRYLRLLQEAKRGDEMACEQLTAGLAHHFSYMIRGYNSVDPAYDRDDLMLQFQLGIWQAIPKVDDRGDPLYHLAWRGQRAVGSLLSVIKQRRHGTKSLVQERGEVSVGTLPEGYDPPDQNDTARPDHELMLAESRREAREQVTAILEHPDLSERQRHMVEVLGVVAVQEHDTNVRLARALGVSAQAAGVLHKRVLTKLTGAVQETALAFPCLACGRSFGSKGALTQHKRGQSGHRPCPAS